MRIRGDMRNPIQTINPQICILLDFDKINQGPPRLSDPTTQALLVDLHLPLDQTYQSHLPN